MPNFWTCLFAAQYKKNLSECLLENQKILSCESFLSACFSAEYVGMLLNNGEFEKRRLFFGCGCFACRILLLRECSGSGGKERYLLNIDHVVRKSLNDR